MLPRLLAHPAARIVLGIVCVVAPVALLLFATSAALPKPWRVAWPQLLAAVLCLAGYRFFVRRFERRAASEAAFEQAWPEWLRGAAIGAAISAAVVGLLAAAGAFAIAGVQDWSALLRPLPEHLLVALLEELVFRAVLFRIVELRWGTRTALLVSSLLFALAHLPNEHITALAVLNTAVASFGLAAGYLLTRRVWLPVGMHFAWNYLFDAVVGVAVSGHPARGWLLAHLSGPEWLSGGAYGVEGSLVTLLVWGAAGAWMLFTSQRQPGYARPA